MRPQGESTHWEDKRERLEKSKLPNLDQRLPASRRVRQYISVAPATQPGSLADYTVWMRHILFFHLSVGSMWLVSIWGLVWLMLLWTFMHNFLCEHMFPFLLGIFRSGLCHMVTVCFNKYIYILVAAGLCCSVRAFSNCGDQGLLFLMVHRLLSVVASLIAERRLWAHGASGVVAHGLNNCGSRALEHKLYSMKDLPKLAIKFVSPALACVFLTTGPPGKWLYNLSTIYIFKSIKESIKIRAEINATEDKLQQKTD